ncbi:hypothetical protein [Sporosarcina cascadiensis]|uniref:hypothetical protein n=1 Tax=Sporosarcina cascadiensis TaxID=2660747 RepID=UPI001890CE0B|nr:hypothetical protein [Sporosarcina cascadiensis]
MMILAPFLGAILSGSIVLLITWGLTKKGFSVLVRNLPGVATVIAAIILFHFGFVTVRGFEGAAYLILALFLVGFALAAFVMTNVMTKKVVITK